MSNGPHLFAPREWALMADKALGDQMINVESVCFLTAAFLLLHIRNTDHWQTNRAKKLHMTGAPVLRVNNTLFYNSAVYTASLF